MSIFLFPQVELGAPKMVCLKYYIVLIRENRFTLGLNTAKNMHYMKKYLK